MTLKNRNMIPVVERFAEKRIKERRARTLDAGFNRFSLLLPWSRALLEPPSPEVSRDLISLQSSMIRERFHAGLKRAVANGKVLGRRPVEDDPKGACQGSQAPRHWHWH